MSVRKDITSFGGRVPEDVADDVPAVGHVGADLQADPGAPPYIVLPVFLRGLRVES